MAKLEDYEFYPNLIEGVRENKCLYDKKDPFYFNRIKKDKAWEEVSKKAKKSPLECRNKWKLLRERYGRELKKEMPSGTGTAEWALLDDMAFLRNSMQPRKSRYVERFKVEETSGSTGEASSMDANFPATTVSTPEKKPKMTFDGLCEHFGNIISRLEKQLDESEPYSDECDDLFLRTILSMMKDLPVSVKDNLKSEFFSKVMQVRCQCRSSSSHKT